MRKGTDKDIYAVILVGGKGKRLKPFSINSHPKAFLPITKTDKTMFRMTLERVRRLVLPDHIIVVANKHHAGLVRKDFPEIGKENLILEPISRNTAPAIALAASVIEKRFTDGVMLIIPSDHYVTDEARYVGCLKKGIDFIKKYWWEDPIIVIGIKPTFPSTGFGYIKLKAKDKRSKAGGVCEVEKFVEKPDFRKAKEFLERGQYLWNAGIFLFKASSILRAMDKFVPVISNAVRRIGKTKIDALYSRLPDISIDYAVMERFHTIYCVRANYGWQDMGSLGILKETLEKELIDFERNMKAKDVAKEPESMRLLERLREITL